MVLLAAIWARLDRVVMMMIGPASPFGRWWSDGRQDGRAFGGATGRETALLWAVRNGHDPSVDPAINFLAEEHDVQWPLRRHYKASADLIPLVCAIFRVKDVEQVDVVWLEPVNEYAAHILDHYGVRAVRWLGAICVHRYCARYQWGD
ncbi:MAG: hypothetical protein NVS2B16_26830 [Chloroflexota bacterium]